MQLCQKGSHCILWWGGETERWTGGNNFYLPSYKPWGHCGSPWILATYVGGVSKEGKLADSKGKIWHAPETPAFTLRFLSTPSSSPLPTQKHPHSSHSSPHLPSAAGQWPLFQPVCMATVSALAASLHSSAEHHFHQQIGLGQMFHLRSRN